LDSFARVHSLRNLPLRRHCAARVVLKEETEMLSIVFASLMLLALVSLSWPLGWLMNRVMNPAPEQTGALRRSFERLFSLAGGKAVDEQQNWKSYGISLMAFNAVMFALAFAAMALQQHLPLNPDGKGALEWSLIFNTAASFVTNTNLQHYSGEVSMSYFTQIFALMWLQFVSAATGLAALCAIARGLAGNEKVGNFYRDLLRATFFILLPLAAICAAALALGGVPMTLKGAVSALTLEGVAQTIARGPAAAMIAIKQLGTNGGGFFGPNSAHPFENPSFWTNIIECFCIVIIPMAAVWLFGRITKKMRHAAVIFLVMLALLACKIGFAIYFESAPASAFSGLSIETSGNLEGKELRFGAAAGPVWAAFTTATSNGSVNCMHDSLNPLTGLIPMVGMWLNVVFGGVGVGMINMLLFVVIGVFICGLMVGRTPEYLSRKLETHEMKLAMLALLTHPLLILGGTAIFAATAWGAATVANPGAHGFSEIMYEFTSSAANNGSGFEGLGDNTVPWNIATGIVMLLSRFIPLLLPLAIAGAMAVKTPVQETLGTLRTDTALFGGVILGTVILIGALLFMPVAVLGPVAEHLTTLHR